MKVLKRLVKLICCIALFFLIIFIIDYIFLNTSYYLKKNTFVETIDIYGNKGGYVPQGLTYSEKYNIVLQTSYNKKNISKLYVIDFDNGNLIKELDIKNSDGKDYYGHVGGITTDDEMVWISNDYVLSEYSLDDIIYNEEGYIKSNKDVELYNRGDFCFYKDNILWIGDFYLKHYVDIKTDKPLLMGYEIDNRYDYSYPEYVISLPKLIQGMAILKDGSFVFTTSFSNVLRSRLLFYDNILFETTDEYYKIDSNKIPYYHFNEDKLFKRVKLSPMAEGMFYKDGYLYILFENSSDEYEFTYPKIRKVIKYKVEE